MFQVAQADYPGFDRAELSGFDGTLRTEQGSGPEGQFTWADVDRKVGDDIVSFSIELIAKLSGEEVRQGHVTPTRRRVRNRYEEQFPTARVTTDVLAVVNGAVKLAVTIRF